MAITSRQGRSLTPRFPELAGLGEAPPVLLDGELMVYGGDGRPDFHALARRPADRTACLAVFDVLDVDGRWVGDRPYGQRRELLTSLDLPDGLTQVVTTRPVAAMWQATADLALEGVVAKHVDSVYTRGGAAAGGCGPNTGAPANCSSTGWPSTPTGASTSSWSAPTAAGPQRGWNSA